MKNCKYLMKYNTLKINSLLERKKEKRNISRLKKEYEKEIKSLYETVNYLREEKKSLLKRIRNKNKKIKELKSGINQYEK